MRRLTSFLVIYVLLVAAKPLSSPEGVIIGEQEWMSKNLTVSAFRNGDPLKYCWNAEEWISAIKSKTPAYAYYNFDPKNGVAHGCLYNQYAIRDRRALAPEGWHIPKQKHLKALVMQDPLIGYALRSKGNQKDGNGLWVHKQHAFESKQDQYGFNALPSGELVAFENGQVQFVGMGTVVSWWTGSAGERAPDLQQSWKLRQNFASMELETNVTSPRYSGHYVRCIRKQKDS